MTLCNIPKLPPLMVIKNGKYAYVTTYHLIWDKNTKQPRREPGKKQNCWENYWWRKHWYY